MILVCFDPAVLSKVDLKNQPLIGSGLAQELQDVGHSS